MASEIGSIQTPDRRRFYSYALVCAAAILFIGFARTYFLKTFFGTPPLYLLLHMHGFLMTSWFLLFGIQTYLVEKHRTDLHRRLGVFGTILASLMLIFGAIVVTINAQEGRVPDAASIPVIISLSYINLLVFGLFVGAAIYFRRRSEFHKRLMLLATLNLLSAAINRIPLDFIESGGLFAVFGLMDLFVLLCVAYDTARHRHLHPAFGWGALATFLWPAVAIALGGSHAGAAFATWVVNKAA